MELWNLQDMKTFFQSTFINACAVTSILMRLQALGLLRDKKGFP